MNDQKGQIYESVNEICSLSDPLNSHMWHIFLYLYIQN